ncbi:MAG: DUF1707 domain-containing protein [Actinomycetota bacterium]|nr:DUF1707 domain-containing protein [Actinomycetota bacterium]
MRINPARPHGIRASDEEREVFAHRIESANGEGRLTLAEADRRLAYAYSATYLYELQWLVADLPTEPIAPGAPAATGFPSRKVKIWLALHALIAVVLFTLLVVQWSFANAPYFWLTPLAFILVSLAAHAWIWRSSWVPREWLGR